MKAMTLATVFVALAGYAVLTVAGRAMDTAGYEAFMVYWSLFFALTGVLDGLMQETTRAVTAAQDAQRRSAQGQSAQERNAQTHGAQASPAARPLVVTAIIAGVTGLLALATGPLWASDISPHLEGWGVGLLALGLLSYAFQATVCGLLSAAQAWTAFAVLISVDSGIRLALAAVAWWMGWDLLAFLIVTVLGAATWLAVLALSPATRTLLPRRADVSFRPFLSRVLQAMVASGANAVMITGFSVLLKFTTDASVAGGALAATITAVTLTRAPILVPLQRFQPALIVHFTKNRYTILSAAVKPIAAVLLLGGVGSVAAYFLAQPIMRLFFREELISDQWVLAALTLASASTAVLMITGSAALAADKHALYSLGWIISTVAAVMVLSWDGTPEWRSILALGVAPLIGVIVHLTVLTLSARRAAAHATAPARGANTPAAAPAPTPTTTQDLTQP
ncbi:MULTISPECIES: hypothetical protein [Corynebacterium]|uniref:hypothetical protein n=1 Tax=Corynebacterium TaxID=1716 RepID=UPI0018657B17|nr:MULTISPECIES: hypothetical protein [Corynebacterium]